MARIIEIAIEGIFVNFFISKNLQPAKVKLPEDRQRQKESGYFGKH